LPGCPLFQSSRITRA